MAWPEELEVKLHLMRQVVLKRNGLYEIPVGDAGIRMVGPILMLYGTETKKQFLPQIAGAEINWSQDILNLIPVQILVNSSD